MEKEGFSTQVKKKGGEIEGKEEGFCRKRKDKKKHFLKKREVCALAQSGRVLKRLRFLFCCAAPTPVKSDFVVAGPSFEDGFNLPGAVDLSVHVVKGAQGNQEELVMEDTPPGPGPAGFLSDFHETVSGDGILAVPVFAGSRRCSDQHETSSSDGILAVPVFAGSRRCSDQHDSFLSAGILTDPVSAGLRTGHLASGSSRSLTRLGRRALRAARRVQVSENSCNCTDSFARSFVPHRRVISRDSDLHALGVSISSSSGLACVSVSRVSGELSASCSLCGCALVCESGALCWVCAEDARQSVVSSGGDHFDHNSWKHGHEAAGGKKALNQSSGSKDGCSFVDTVVGGAALIQYLRGGAKRNES